MWTTSGFKSNRLERMASRSAVCLTSTLMWNTCLNGWLTSPINTSLSRCLRKWWSIVVVSKALSSKAESITKVIKISMIGFVSNLTNISSRRDGLIESFFRNNYVIKLWKLTSSQKSQTWSQRLNSPWEKSLCKQAFIPAWILLFQGSQIHENQTCFIPLNYETSSNFK